MSRKCEVTGKAVLSGNNVSHSNRKTRRRFLPNIQEKNIFSVALGRSVSLKLTASGMRTLEHKGGLDAWLLDTSVSKLTSELRALKKQITEKTTAKAA